MFGGGLAQDSVPPIDTKSGKYAEVYVASANQRKGAGVFQKHLMVLQCRENFENMITFMSWIDWRMQKKRLKNFWIRICAATGPMQPCQTTA